MGARISVLIEYIPSGNGSIDYGVTAETLTEQGNDISNPQTINTTHSGGIKPFIWGVSRIGSIEEGGDGSHFWSNPTGEPIIVDGRQLGGYYSGFWGKEPSNVNGEFDYPISFQIVGENIDKFVIRFDEALGEYATVINVDGKDYDNTGEFIWTGIESNVHNITIKKWNKPKRQTKITSILIGLVVEYDKQYFQRSGRIVAGSRRTFDNTKPNFGVVSQYGSFRAIDIDGNFAELSQADLLIDGLRCGVFMNAKSYEAGMSYDDYKTVNKDKMLGDYRLAEVGFIGDNVNAELTDDILNWGSTYQDGIEDNTENTAHTIFTGLQEATPSTVNIDQEMIDYLKGFSIPDGYISPGMLDSAWDTFCWATLTRISKDIKGDIWLTM